jgi:hypothetical protein
LLEKERGWPSWLELDTILPFAPEIFGPDTTRTELVVTSEEEEEEEEEEDGDGGEGGNEKRRVAEEREEEEEMKVLKDQYIASELAAQRQRAQERGGIGGMIRTVGDALVGVADAVLDKDGKIQLQAMEEAAQVRPFQKSLRRTLQNENANESVNESVDENDSVNESMPLLSRAVVDVGRDDVVAVSEMPPRGFVASETLRRRHVANLAIPAGPPAPHP